VKYGYILRRIGILIATLYTVITITFILIRLSPYNPYAYFLSQEQSMGIASPTELAAMAEYYYNLIPNQPIYVQYFEYLWAIMRGNFGHSLIYPQMTVANIIATRLPWTLYIVITSTVISFLIGTYAGQRLGYMKGGKVDGGVVTSSPSFTRSPFTESASSCSTSWPSKPVFFLRPAHIQPPSLPAPTCRS